MNIPRIISEHSIGVCLSLFSHSSEMVKKHYNSLHREKLLPLRRAGRKIRGWLKVTRLMLQIIGPERMVQEFIHESPVSISFPRPSIKENEAHNTMGLQLHFKSEWPDAILYTGTIIPPVVIVIQRGNSEEAEVELTGPLSSIMVEMVVLNGEFEKEDWTEEEFKDNIIKPREGKGPLLIGKTAVALKDGIGTFDNIKITDNSRWTRLGFSLGVRVVQGSAVKERIREARSKAFPVQDIRGKPYEKHDSPLPTDEIWRLKNIRKNGPYFNKLTDIGIKTVQDFLRLSNTDPDSLQSIFIRQKKALEETLIHAQKCTMDEKYYIYSSSEEEFMLLLNSIYKAVGLGRKCSGCFQKLDVLAPPLKCKVEILKRKAYKNKEKIEEYIEEPFSGPLKPQEVASIPLNLPNPEAITHLNELASSSYPTNVMCNTGICSEVSNLQPSPSFPGICSEGAIFGVTDFSNEQHGDHINYWLEMINSDVWRDLGIEEGHASFHESVPSISFQVRLAWLSLRAVLHWKMRIKKIVASKKTDKIQ